MDSLHRDVSPRGGLRQGQKLSLLRMYCGVHCGKYLTTAARSARGRPIPAKKTGMTASAVPKTAATGHGRKLLRQPGAPSSLPGPAAAPWPPCRGRDRVGAGGACRAARLLVSDTDWAGGEVR